MWRYLVVLGVVLASAAPAAAQEAPPSVRVTQTDHSGYPQITLSVSVTNPSGAPLPGLSANDFRVTEDGMPVDIQAFSGVGAPISAVLVLDRSGSMEQAGKLAGAKQAAKAFVSMLRPEDQAALISFSDRPELETDFTSDHGRIERAIRRLRADGSTALYDSIIAGVDALHDVPGRRALVVLTDGRDRTSVEDAAPASTHSLDDAIEAARQAGIAAQVIGLGQKTSDDLMDGIDEPVLQQIAEQTGGQYFYAPGATTLAELYASLATSMQHEYQLTYRSPRPYYDGTRRDIQVVVDGAATTSGGYVEPHMIHVRSNPWVALALLVPLIGLLLAPRFVRARRSEVVDVQTVAPATEAAKTVALNPSFCDQCGARLRPGSRFCATCGARVVAPPSSEAQQ